MDHGRKFMYGRGGPVNAHEQAVNTSFNDNPYSIELDRLEVLDVKPDNPFMMSVLDTRKSLLEDAKVVRRILGRDTFYGDRSPSPIRKPKTRKSKKNKDKDSENINDEHQEDEEDEAGEGNVFSMNDEDGQQQNAEEEGENPKKEKAEEDGSDESEEEDVEAEEDMDLDNDYMENHFDNGEDYIIDE